MCACWRPPEPAGVGTDAAAGAEAMAAPAPQYLFDPSDKPALPLHDVPLIVATDESVQGYGALVEHPDDIEIEIVRWPATGWRQVDEDSGDEAGWVEGTFHGEWQGDVLFGRNDAVSGHYVLGWSTTDPAASRTDRQTAGRERVIRSTSPSSNMETPTATARNVLPVPAGPSPNTSSLEFSART